MRFYCVFKLALKFIRTQTSDNFPNLAHLINERYLGTWAMYESTTALFTIYMAT